MIDAICLADAADAADADEEDAEAADATDADEEDAEAADATDADEEDAEAADALFSFIIFNIFLWSSVPLRGVHHLSFPSLYFFNASIYFIYLLLPDKKVIER
uniref:Uncharacterized protein n=1 Tax=viral metagenome TaxID=1070528 RepID=A0A6C0LPS2_9ZZZZ